MPALNRELKIDLNDFSIVLKIVEYKPLDKGLIINIIAKGKTNMI